MQSLTELLVLSKRLVLPSSKFITLLPSSCRRQVRFVTTSSTSGGGGSGGDPTGGSSSKRGGSSSSSSSSDFVGMTGGGGTMRSWQIHSYGGPSELQLSTSVRIPPLNGPEEVLVRVKAASVNPIDLAMSHGYGAETINILRDLCPSTPPALADLPQKLSSYLMAPVAGKKSVIEFPLTLGRDFAGTVEQVGHGVNKSDLKVGDEVYGVVGVQRQGAHSEFVVVAGDTIRRKPTNLSFTEAASLPYVGLTAWSAIRVTGSYFDLSDKKFLVLGGSGGVGTFAIQYLRSQGADVVATCSTDAVPLVKSLGANAVIDYTDPEGMRMIQDFAPYDCILHLSGQSTTTTSIQLTKHLRQVSGQFITLSPPFLSNIDKHGLVGGIAKNFSELVMSNVKTWTDSKAITKWAFFIPSGEPLGTFAELVERGEIKPVMESVYKFDNLPDAYRRLEEGHLRGKVVVEL